MVDLKKEYELLQLKYESLKHIADLYPDGERKQMLGVVRSLKNKLHAALKGQATLKQKLEKLTQSDLTFKEKVAKAVLEEAARYLEERAGTCTQSERQRTCHRCVELKNAAAGVKTLSLEGLLRRFT